MTAVRPNFEIEINRDHDLPDKTNAVNPQKIQKSIIDNNTGNKAEITERTSCPSKSSTYENLVYGNNVFWALSKELKVQSYIFYHTFCLKI
jgi:hypothetical protein